MCQIAVSDRKTSMLAPMFSNLVQLATEMEAHYKAKAAVVGLLGLAILLLVDPPVIQLLTVSVVK